MTTEAGLLSTTGPLRSATEEALTALGYTPTPNRTGDVLLSTIVTAPKIAWLAEFALHESSSVIIASVIVSTVFEPKIKKAEIPELLTRLNSAVAFGCYFNPVGQDSVVYRTAHNFPDGVTAARVGKFLGTLSFPLSLWREISAPFPKGTDLKSRLDAALIRLDAHDGEAISRRTRRALLRLIQADETAETFEPKPSAFSLMLI